MITEKKMARAAKYRKERQFYKTLSCSAPSVLCEGLDRLSKETGISKNRIIELALIDILDGHGIPIGIGHTPEPAKQPTKKEKETYQCEECFTVRADKEEPCPNERCGK